MWILNHKVVLFFFLHFNDYITSFLLSDRRTRGPSGTSLPCQRYIMRLISLLYTRYNFSFSLPQWFKWNLLFVFMHSVCLAFVLYKGVIELYIVFLLKRVFCQTWIRLRLTSKRGISGSLRMQIEVEGTVSASPQPDICPSTNSSLTHSSGYFKGQLGIFPFVFVASKVGVFFFFFFFKKTAEISSCFSGQRNGIYFPREVAPSPSAIVPTKTENPSQTIIS